MNSATEFAYAKINLGLDVLGKRADGYHQIFTVMQTLALCDEITVTETEKNSGIKLETNHPSLSCGEDNLAYKAAVLLAAHGNVEPNVHIVLHKKIFLSAGLAGGSSDAAAVLRGLNKLWGMRLSFRELEELGSKLGSDVSFCIGGGTAIAKGRGEILSPLPDLPQTNVVLAKPKGLEVSTAGVYGGYNPARVIRRPDIRSIAENISRGAPAFAHHMANVLETVTIPEYPILASIKAAMLGAGAYISLMSGSGPTVFALARTFSDAQNIAASLSAYDVDTAITTTVGRII